MLNGTKYKNTYEFNVYKKIQAKFFNLPNFTATIFIVLGNTDKNLINQFNHARAYTCTLDCILFYETKNSFYEYSTGMAYTFLHLRKRVF